jgi:hypothetical protein
MPGTGYQGDPGLFGSIFGIAKKAIGFVPGVGPIAQTALGLASKAFRKDPKQIGTLKGRVGAGVGGCPPGMRPHFRTGQCSATGVTKFQGAEPISPLRRGLQMVLPGGATGFEGLGPEGMIPKGYHLNKSGYFRGGRPKSDYPEVEWVPPRSTAVRNRRRNPLNPRAADRAIGRISSAKKFAAKLGRITIRKDCSCK